MEVLPATKKMMFSMSHTQMTLNTTSSYLLSTRMASTKDVFIIADAQELQIMPSNFFNITFSLPVSANLKLCSHLMSSTTFTLIPWNARLQQEAFIANSEDSRQAYS
jgi:hypothetical protein